MRPDMYEVIIETTRGGGSYARKGRARPLEELPFREAMWQQSGDSKYQRDHLAPLRRFLFRRVGRPWDDVFSEICAQVDCRSHVQNHVILHLEDYVALRCGRDRDGRIWAHRRWFGPRALWYQPLFVDPDTGILRDSRSHAPWVAALSKARGWRERWQAARLAGDAPLTPLTGAPRVELDDDDWLVQADGLWFRFAFARAGAGEEVWCHWRRTVLTGGGRYAATKQQLSKAELKAHGLENRPS